MTRYVRCPNGPTTLMKDTMTSRPMRGFSLLEMMIVLAIMMVVASISFVSMQPILRQERVTNAYNTTLMTIRRAREAAISERRTYIVTFNGAVTPNTVSISPQNLAVANGVNVTYTLPNDVTFLASGLPATGPDGFGGGATAIDFDQAVPGGDKTKLYFTPDGSAQDGNNNINNGVLYLARASDTYSARAITVWGATGRLRGWQLKAGSPDKWSQL